MVSKFIVVTTQKTKYSIIPPPPKSNYNKYIEKNSFIRKKNLK